MNPVNLLHKYGNLSKLPSGTAQLQQIRHLVVAKLWVEQNPDRDDLNYDDPVAVAREVPTNWWLEHVSCKYILSLLVHKDNKDISSQPATLPAGPKCKDIREAKRRSVEKERADARRLLMSEVSGGNVSSLSEKENVDHEAKKAKIDGMRSVIGLKKIEAISTQIAVMERLENVYVARMDGEAYERKLVNLVNKLPDINDEDEES